MEAACELPDAYWHLLRRNPSTWVAAIKLLSHQDCAGSVGNKNGSKPVQIANYRRFSQLLSDYIVVARQYATTDGGSDRATICREEEEVVGARAGAEEDAGPLALEQLMSPRACAGPNPSAIVPEQPHQAANAVFDTTPCITSSCGQTPPDCIVATAAAGLAGTSVDDDEEESNDFVKRFDMLPALEMDPESADGGTRMVHVFLHR
eukprot:SAG11_NODE_6058_length_1398_cov_1.438029_1_plen_206_part_00